MIRNYRFFSLNFTTNKKLAIDWPFYRRLPVVLRVSGETKNVFFLPEASLPRLDGWSLAPSAASSPCRR